MERTQNSRKSRLGPGPDCHWCSLSRPVSRSSNQCAANKPGDFSFTSLAWVFIVELICACRKLRPTDQGTTRGWLASQYLSRPHTETTHSVLSLRSFEPAF